MQNSESLGQGIQGIDADFVKLIVRFTDEVPVGSESLWAKPAGEGEDTFVLHNVSMFCALAPDDVVRVTRGGDSRLQITEVVSVAKRCVAGLDLSGVGGLSLRKPQQVAPSREVLDHASVAFARRLEARGAHVEGPAGSLTTSWPLNMSASQVRKRIAEAMQGHEDWVVAGVWSPDERVDGFADFIDFGPCQG